MNDHEDFKAEVLRSLNRGKEYALKGKLLQSRMGETSTRRIRLAINELIEDGVPVVFCDKGYYIAESPEECIEALKKLRSYGVMLFQHYKYLKKAAHSNFSGQIPMRF